MKIHTSITGQHFSLADLFNQLSLSFLQDVSSYPSNADHTEILAHFKGFSVPLGHRCSGRQGLRPQTN